VKIEGTIGRGIIFNISCKKIEEDLLMDKEKETYETPNVEIIEFALEDSIAASGDFGSNTICGEETY
jgi:hypothetical protein